MNKKYVTEFFNLEGHQMADARSSAIFTKQECQSRNKIKPTYNKQYANYRHLKIMRECLR